MSTLKINYVLVDENKNIIFKKRYTKFNTDYKVIWLDSTLTKKEHSTIGIDKKYKKFESEEFLKESQRKLFLRLFKKILFLIESGDCDKIIILISQSAIDLFRSLVPKEIIQIIALQIKENHSKLSLSQIDEKILSDFYIN